jgi:hypothetical protein
LVASTGLWELGVKNHHQDRRLTLQRFLPAEQRVQDNSKYSKWGPVFDVAPSEFGVYGNRNSLDLNYYVENNPYEDLRARWMLNGQDIATDYVAGLCQGVYAWLIDLSPANSVFSLDIRLPVDDYRGAGDLLELRSADAGTWTRNREFWTGELDHSSTQCQFRTAGTPWPH